MDLLHIIVWKREVEDMKYEELKEYLKKNPFCFRTIEEKEKEFDLKIIKREGKNINFTRAARDRSNY
jgi:hypothetical protein